MQWVFNYGPLQRQHKPQTASTAGLRPLHHLQRHFEPIHTPITYQQKEQKINFQNSNLKNFKDKQKQSHESE